MSVIMKEITPSESLVLTDFLYHAIFIPSGTEPPSREVIVKPEIAVYIDGFGSQKG
jgi:hypothetical protein